MAVSNRLRDPPDPRWRRPAPHEWSRESGSFRRRFRAGVPGIQPVGDVRSTSCSRRRLGDPFGRFIYQPMHNDRGDPNEVSAFHPATDVVATRFA
jgi:hypothetical protein